MERGRDAPSLGEKGKKGGFVTSKEIEGNRSPRMGSGEKKPKK